MTMKTLKFLTATLMLTSAIAGCDGRPSLLPNKDPALQKTSTRFAADAAKRSYEADAPLGGEAIARAEVDYTLKEVRIGNLSADDWTDVEIWVNKKYVVFLPSLPKLNKGEGFRHLNFQLLYDNHGEHFPVGVFNSKMRVDKVQVFREGKMYDVPAPLMD